MPAAERNAVLRYLRRLVDAPGAGAVADAELLERFVAVRDEAVFELLLWRHAAMVLDVCQGVLRDAHAAEDAFQATFLVLARKAASIGKGESLGGWLYRVAYRVALKARARGAKQPDGPPQALDALAARAADPADAAALRELRPLLYEEVERLPPKYRAPVVLCYLEGKTNEEAACQLGWTRGTVSGRLARARDLLRRRLTRRGLALSGVALFALLAPGTASAAVPAALVDATVRGALLFAAGQAAAGVVSSSAVTLAEGVLKTMGITKLKLAAAVLLAFGIVGVGAGVVSQNVLVMRPPDATAQEAAARQAAGEIKDLAEIPSQRDGIVLLVGREIKDGENVPAERVVIIKVRGEAKRFRRWKVGDTVEEGDLLAQVDDRLARDELASKQASVEAAKAEWEAAVKTVKEAEQRYKTMEKLYGEAKNNTSLVSLEELRGAKLTWDRYFYEEISKRERIKIAESEMRQAETVLEQHQVRSRVRGTIKAIYKLPGEGVKKLEPVVRIQVAPDRD
jgi:RNA polymerase sigma factor (sigma-70 family)